MKPTPLTDAAIEKEITCTEGGEYECTVYPVQELVDADFARGLERRVAELEEALHLANGTAELAMQHRDAAEKELTAFKERLAYLSNPDNDPLA